MSAKDDQTGGTAQGPDLGDLNANDAVLGDEGVPPTVHSERPVTQTAQAIGPNRSAPPPVTDGPPQEPVYVVKRSTVKHLTGVAAGLTIAALGAGLIVGTLVGRTGAKATTPERVTVTVTVPVNANSREAIAKRNVVWRVLNHEGDSLPETPEKRLGQALDLLISKDADIESRQEGFTAFIKKGAAYFDETQSRAFAQAFAEGSPADAAAALKKIVIADGDASDLLRGVMTDQKRIQSIVSGKKVPLETMPDGSRP